MSVDAAEAGEGRLYRFSERRMRFEAERRDETRRTSSRSSSTWMTTHEDLRASPRCHATFDALAEGLARYAS